MKYIPIIFSTAMVQANHARRKNQTRRLKGLEEINKAPDDWYLDDIGYSKKAYQPKQALAVFRKKANKIETKLIICPYGHVGDVLWVREAFAHTKQLNLAPDDENYGFVYKAEDESILWNDIEGWRWRPSIHMPIEACRSWCVVTGIECQQLQDITGEDAIGEGIKWDGNLAYPAFHTLWVNINGLESWKANPWVWVVRYEHTTIPPAGWDEHVKAVTAKRRSK